MVKKIIVLLSLLFASLNLLAEEKTLSLQDAIALALKNNPAVLIAEKELDASQGRRLQLEAMPNPEFVFSTEGISVKDSVEESEISLGLQQLIEFPGKRGLRKRIGRYEEDIARWNVERVKLIVTSKVKKAYFKAFYSQKAVSDLHSILNVLKQYQDMANIRFQSGLVSSVDVIRGRLEYLRAENELIEARRQLGEDLISLNLALGREGYEPVSLLTELGFTLLEKSLETLKKEAEERPSLKALNSELTRAIAELGLAKKSSLPDFKLTFFYPSLRFGSWGIAVESTIPLWLKRQKGEVKEADALSLGLLISFEAKRKKVMSLIESSYSDLKAAENQLNLFQKSLLSEVEEMLNMAIINYQFGKTDSLNLFDVYRMYKAAKIEYLKALLNYNIFLAELEVAGEEED